MRTDMSGPDHAAETLELLIHRVRVVVYAGLLTFVLEQEVVASHVIMVIVKSDDAM